jgi:transcriptional regulator with XRE-family HTH domain
MDPSPRFGDELRRRREAAGLSLSALAARVHYSKSHLSRVENSAKEAGGSLARRCDAELGADGQLARLADRRPAKPAAEREPAEPDLDGPVPSCDWLPDRHVTGTPPIASQPEATRWRAEALRLETAGEFVAAADLYHLHGDARTAGQLFERAATEAGPRDAGATVGGSGDRPGLLRSRPEYE